LDDLCDGDRDLPPGYVDPEYGWLPSTPDGQSCAICGEANVVWLHPLAKDKVRFRVYGKQHTLPTFWTLCEHCERLYAAGIDVELVDLMIRQATEDEIAWSDDAVNEEFGQQLSVFRRSDIGARRFDGRPSAPTSI
jgi:hypothetical protein